MKAAPLSVIFAAVEVLLRNFVWPTFPYRPAGGRPVPPQGKRSALAPWAGIGLRADTRPDPHSPEVPRRCRPGRSCQLSAGLRTQVLVNHLPKGAAGEPDSNLFDSSKKGARLALYPSSPLLLFLRADQLPPAHLNALPVCFLLHCRSQRFVVKEDHFRAVSFSFHVSLETLKSPLS